MVPVRGNRLTLLDSGAEFFPALESAIDAAREDVRLETYIYVDDEAGRRIAEALKRAAARGVRVRAMIDAFGSRGLHKAFVPGLQAAGVEVQLFRPAESWLSLQRTRLRRLHRKIVLVDGRVAFVGGLNIIDDRTDNPTGARRLDYAVRVEGRWSRGSTRRCTASGGSSPRFRHGGAIPSSGRRASTRSPRAKAWPRSCVATTCATGTTSRPCTCAASAGRAARS